jgi:acyl-CoA thioester hydrolase
VTARPGPSATDAGGTTDHTERGPADPSDPAAYPFVHPVSSRFADVDSLGHINNVAIAVFYEDARVEFMRTVFGRNIFRQDDPRSMVLAELTIRYLAEATHPGRYLVGLGIARIGRTSMVHHGALFRGGTLLGTVRSVLVNVEDHRPAELTASMRACLDAMSFGAGRSR